MYSSLREKNTRTHKTNPPKIRREGKKKHNRRKKKGRRKGKKKQDYGLTGSCRFVDKMQCNASNGWMDDLNEHGSEVEIGNLHVLLTLLLMYCTMDMMDDTTTYDVCTMAMTMYDVR